MDNGLDSMTVHETGWVMWLPWRQETGAGVTRLKETTNAKQL